MLERQKLDIILPNTPSIELGEKGEQQPSLGGVTTEGRCVGEEVFIGRNGPKIKPVYAHQTSWKKL